jgi:hypothetical protein
LLERCYGDDGELEFWHKVALAATVCHGKWHAHTLVQPT